jgi:hypothetical protein
VLWKWDVSSGTAHVAFLRVWTMHRTLLLLLLLLRPGPALAVRKRREDCFLFVRHRGLAFLHPDMAARVPQTATFYTRPAARSWTASSASSFSPAAVQQRIPPDYRQTALASLPSIAAELGVSDMYTSKANRTASVCLLARLQDPRRVVGSDISPRRALVPRHPYRLARAAQGPRC